ncbi:hypothetical protein ABZ891_14675 [Streptomyces sp. NPDC047023]|uniref:hypothetical protein n=1 Tax=Streptomyces sp. NPDC047023 TaxID=3155139 RepID=UPI00340729E9
MAGESPDKSVDEAAPGAARSSAERDPRLSVFRPRDPEGGVARATGAASEAEAAGAAAGDDESEAVAASETQSEAVAETGTEAEAEVEAGQRDALREAVAAWVATTDEPAPAREEHPPPADEPTPRTKPAPDRSAQDSASGTRAAAAKPAAGADAAAAKPADDAADPVEEQASAPVPAVAGRPAARPADGVDAGRDTDADRGSAGRGASADAAADPVEARPSAPVPATGGRPAVKPADGVDAGRDSGSAERGAAAKPAGEANTAPDSGSGARADAAKPAAGEDGDHAKPADAGADPVEERASAPAPAANGRPAAKPADGADGDRKTDADGDSASGSGSAGGGSERTAVFRVPRVATVKAAGDATKGGGAKDAPAKPAAGGPAAKPDAPTRGGDTAGEPADSERTAVFRAPRPEAAPTGDSDTTAVFRAPKAPAPDSASDSASGSGQAAAEPSEDSERTAVFRAPKAGPAPAARPAEDTGTTVIRAVKPNAPKPDAAKPESGAAPKASTFVPLRTDGDDAPASTPKPSPTPTPGPGLRFDKKLAPPAPPGSAASETTTKRFDRASDRTERTTQQPLPPKPPLDMLADLTNNPPPPPSPLRTAIRRFKIYAPLVVLLAIILGIVQLVRPLPEPTLVMTAKSSYTFEGGKPQLPWPSEGQAYMAAAGLGTLGQSGEQKPVPIASVTKSMTAYIILRDHPIKKGEQGAMIDVDKTAETEGKKNDSVNNESTLDTVKEGDKISEYDAIAAIMIPSANNIARLLARWDAGSQEAFVKKMNDTAKELGMTNTTYTDPSGLDATTVSTAEDQVKLGLKLVEIETLLDITKKPKWVDPSGKEWRNWNGLVPFNDSLGIKTGTTTKAGGNLLFAAQKKIGNTNQLIVGAVLGQHKPPIIDSVLAASKQLLVATQKSLEGATVVKKGDVVGYVDDGLGGRTPVVATADVQAIGWPSLTVDVKLGNGGGPMPQTAKAGTEVGLLTVGEGASQVKVPVALQSDLASPGIGSKLTRVG